MIAIPKGNLCSHVMHFIPDKEVATPAGEKKLTTLFPDDNGV